MPKGDQTSAFRHGFYAPCLLAVVLWAAQLPVICSAAVSTEPWALVGADFRSRPVALVSMDENGLKVTATDGSAPKALSWDNVLQLDRPASPRTGGGGFTLYLNGGDVITGDPVTIAHDTVTWKHALLGDLPIPEDRVNALVRSGQSIEGIDEPRKTDVVRLTNGDQTTGIIESMSASTVSIRPTGADTPADIAMDKVNAILLADSDPRAGPANRAFRVWLNDGTTLTLPVVRVSPADGDSITLGFSAQSAQKIDLGMVHSIEQVNGPVTWLTNLTPGEVIYKPFLSAAFPPRFDHPVGDEAVTIHQKFPAFRHGIGVHSYTKLSYAVPQGCVAFRAQYAIDNIPGSDMGKADVTVRLIVDDKVVKEIPHVRWGKTAAPVVINVKGAKTLALEVDYGDNLDAQDRFVWLDPAFLKTAPAEETPATQPGPVQ